jgi:hypothetical protein
MAGRCLTELVQPDRAEPLLLDAIDGYNGSHVREVALYGSCSGRPMPRWVTSTTRAPRRCVLDAVEGVNSARVDRRVIVLRGALRPLRHVPAVRDIEERSQAIGTGWDPP